MFCVGENGGCLVYVAKEKVSTCRFHDPHLELDDLREQTAGTMLHYPTQTHYSGTVLTTMSILLTLNAKVGSDKCQSSGVIVLNRLRCAVLTSLKGRSHYNH